MKINPASSVADLPGAYAEDSLAVPAAALPLLPALLVVAALLPEELSLNISGLFLSLPRLVLLAAFPLLFARTLRQATQPGFHASLSDLLILPATAWMFLSVAMSEGLQRATVGSSVLILEFAGSYLVMRTLPDRPGTAMTVARFTAGAIAVAALLGPLDTLTGQHITHDIANVLTHYNKGWWVEYRNGLTRAQGAQEHPILLGCLCCFGTLLSFSVFRGAQRAIAVACCLVGLLSAISSAPIMGTLIGFSLLFYRQCTPWFKSRWLWLGTIMGMTIGSVLVLVPSPFGFIFQHFTMDPQTGWYRLLIWQVVGPLLLDSPLFGIGLDDWERESWMPSTVDSIWLRSAMEFGIVGSVLIALVVIGACSRAMRPSGRMELPAAEQALGLCLGIIAFLFIYLGFTVHFWGCTWLLLAMFVGLRAHLGALAAGQPRLDADDNPF
jgi:hypothetical protein